MLAGDSQNPGDVREDPLVGRTLNGRFSVKEPIGSGGMGKVYRAVQSPLDRVVALKVLNPNFPSAKDPGFLQRFLREASLTAKLRHPNTVTVIDYGQTEDGINYIAMEYLEGRTLGQVLAQVGVLPWQRVLNISQQVCRSLREAHNLGVVHRDLKPANIMLLNEADSDLVKVLDFGLVKSVAPPTPDMPFNPEITQNGTFLGSPQYMAPEQARNVADIRSDVYSLGVVMFQMLVGRPPFVAKDPIELIFAHYKEPPPTFSSVRPELSSPPELEALVRRCLEKEPEKRYQSMDELLEAMRGANASAGGSSGVFQRPGGHNTTGPHATPGFAVEPVTNQTLALDISVELPDSEKQARRRRTVVAVLVGLAVLLGFGGTVLYLSGERSRPEAPAPAPAVVAAPTPPPVAPAAQAAPSTVRFRLGSQPPGARVYYMGEEKGATPLELELPKGADGTATGEFTFVLEGYQTETVVTGGSGEVVFSQKLERARGGATKPAGGVAGAASRAEPASARVDPTELGADVSAPVMMVAEARPARPEPAGASASPAPTSPAAQAAPAADAPPAAAPAGSGGTPGAVSALSAQAVPTGDGVVPFSEEMQRPKQLSGQEIVYTREALEAKVEGTMAVRCIITPQGQVERCRVIKGLPYMNEAVVSALQSRRYEPVKLQGQPVSVAYVFTLRLVPPRQRR